MPTSPPARSSCSGARRRRPTPQLILDSQPHPEQDLRAYLGILRLARQYGCDHIEAACDRGFTIGARSYGLILSIRRETSGGARSARRGPSVTGIKGGEGRTDLVWLASGGKSGIRRLEWDGASTRMMVIASM
jgi:hypothetical protein